MGAVLALFTVQAVRLALFKAFGIDEFEYSHAAWLISTGAVPYEDFFEPHFPLLMQVLAAPLALVGAEPESMLWLRLLMLPFLALSCFAGAVVAGRGEARQGALAAVFLLAAGPFVGPATEIRPDAVAFAFFLAALACLYRRRSFTSGLCLALSAWASQKALLYGAVLPALAVVDLARDRASPRSVSDLRAFALGLGGGGLVVALYLTMTGSWAAWARWSLVWASHHERAYPGFPWTTWLEPALRETAWLLVLAALGVAATARRLGRDSHDWALLAALPATFLSFAIQQAAFPYSLLPFAGVVAVLAARGVAALARAAQAQWTLAGALGLMVAAALAGAGLDLERRLARGNAHQLDELRALGRLTEPGDPVYDNSGSATARPHLGFYPVTDALMRVDRAEELAREIPALIEAAGCTVVLRDLRYEGLPGPLRAWIEEHFQPYSADIWLWGRRYAAPSGELDDRFLAVRSGSYFAHPPTVLEIDGVRVTSPVFQLSRGTHTVRSDGAPGDVFILWLPASGERYRPVPRGEPGFSVLF